MDSKQSKAKTSTILIKEENKTIPFGGLGGLYIGQFVLYAFQYPLAACILEIPILLALYFWLKTATSLDNRIRLVLLFIHLVQACYTIFLFYLDKDDLKSFTILIGIQIIEFQAIITLLKVKRDKTKTLLWPAIVLSTICLGYIFFIFTKLESFVHYAFIFILLLQHFFMIYWSLTSKLPRMFMLLAATCILLGNFIATYDFVIHATYLEQGIRVLFLNAGLLFFTYSIRTYTLKLR